MVDFGVIEMMTGDAGDGNVIIWWGAESMDKMQKTQDFFTEKGSELFADEKWKAMYEDMEKVRKPLSSNIGRALVWAEKDASE